MAHFFRVAALLAAFSTLALGERPIARERELGSALQPEKQEFKIMSLNVQFYAQMCKVLAAARDAMTKVPAEEQPAFMRDMASLKVPYAQFKHTDQIKPGAEYQYGFSNEVMQQMQSQIDAGMSLDELAGTLPPMGSAGDTKGFTLFKRLGCVDDDFESIKHFLRMQKPDLVAIQEGLKGMDLDTSDGTYDLQTKSTIDAELHFAAKGVLVNQVLVNNAKVRTLADFSMVTKNGGGHGLPEIADDVAGPRDVKRGAAAVQVQVGHQSFVFISIHLTGGRFDDKYWEEYGEDGKEQRWKEINAAISHVKETYPDQPVLICGDFNAPSTLEEVETNMGYYFSNILKGPKEKWQTFVNYMIGVHERLLKEGWKPVYTKSEMDTRGFPFTSAFGSSVDWIYKSPNWPESMKVQLSEVVDVFRASIFPSDKPLRVSLTDHNAVVLKLEVEAA